MEQPGQEKTPFSEAVEVTLSEDGMTASVMLRRESAANIISPQDVIGLLERHGVRYGLLDEAIRRFTEQPALFCGDPLVVARGVPPVDGKDGHIDYVYRHVEEGPKFLEAPDGSIDFRQVKNVNNIKKGQLLARRIPASDGVDGINVKGEKLKAKKGREAYWKLGKNVVLDQERDVVYAVIDGQVCFTDGDKLNVFPVYEVHGDVDFSVGNIDFVGTVVVRGHVLAGFQVKAEGDLRVDGGIEGAFVDVKGSIEVTSGITAQHKGSIRAGVDIKAGYIHNANITAGRDIVVSQSIMHSHVSAGRNVICRGSKGLIVGGVVQAGEQVIALTIGNSLFTPTVIEVGAKPELRRELAEIEQETAALAQNLHKTLQALQLLEKMIHTVGSLPAGKQELWNKLAHTRKVQQETLDRLTVRRNELIAELKGDSPARVEVLGRIYSGTKLVIGNINLYINDHYSRVFFVAENGEIVGHPIYKAGS